MYKPFLLPYLLVQAYWRVTFFEVRHRSPWSSWQSRWDHWALFHSCPSVTFDPDTSVWSYYLVQPDRPNNQQLPQDSGVTVCGVFMCTISLTTWGLLAVGLIWLWRKSLRFHWKLKSPSLGRAAFTGWEHTVVDRSGCEWFICSFSALECWPKPR